MSKIIKIYTPPISDFTVGNPCTSTNTTFTNTSIIANGDIPVYTWIVAGNRFNNRDMTHSYTKQGLYPVT
ncbi:hypothetical protein ABTM14_19730, partial [Acinetobacter baumannii]